MDIKLRKIKEDDLEKIMYWRMDPEITRYMNTDPVLTLEGQKKWLNEISNKDTVRYWLIVVEGQPAGVICLLNIDWKNNICSWGYYIGEKSLRSLKLALSLEMSLYDYAFSTLGMNELLSDVFCLNEGVIKLHQACGGKIIKVVKNEVEKNGEFYDVAHISITKSEWNHIKLSKKYDRYIFN